MRAAPLLVVALALASPAGAQVLLEVHGWGAAMDGSAQIVERGVGTVVDFERDLGLEDSDLPAFRLSWRGARTFASLLYEQTSWSGDRVVERTIAFSGQTYTFGTRVVSDLELRRGALQLGWQPLADARGTFAFGPMVELAGLWFDGRLAAPDLTPPVREQDSLEAPAPALGVAVDVVPVRWLRLAARGALLEVSGTGSYRSVEAGFVAGPFARVAVTGGWRSFRFEYEDRPDEAEIELAGPYLGVAASF